MHIFCSVTLMFSPSAQSFSSETLLCCSGCMAYDITSPVVTEKHFYVVHGMLLNLEPTDEVKGM